MSRDIDIDTYRIRKKTQDAAIYKKEDTSKNIAKTNSFIGDFMEIIYKCTRKCGKYH